MADEICAACGQPLQHAPTRCFSCNRPITPGQAYTHEKVRGICTPRHRDCQQKPLL